MQIKQSKSSLQQVNLPGAWPLMRLPAVNLGQCFSTCENKENMLKKTYNPLQKFKLEYTPVEYTPVWQVMLQKLELNNSLQKKL